MACTNFPSHMWFGNMEHFGLFDKIEYADMKDILKDQKDYEVVGVDIHIKHIGYDRPMFYSNKVEITFTLNGKEFSVIKEYDFYDDFDNALYQARDIQDEDEEEKEEEEEEEEEDKKEEEDKSLVHSMLEQLKLKWFGFISKIDDEKYDAKKIDWIHSNLKEITNDWLDELRERVDSAFMEDHQEDNK